VSGRPAAPSDRDLAPVAVGDRDPVVAPAEESVSPDVVLVTPTSRSDRMFNASVAEVERDANLPDRPLESSGRVTQNGT
jgi:hypothetical protein